MSYLDARAYDALQTAHGKDYVAEARSVVGRIRGHQPDARSLLDVACGTGRHLEVFASEFPDCAGVDASPIMLAEARRRVPNVPLSQADFTGFDLGRQFDAVVCMFSAIGYAHTRERLHNAAKSIARHVSPGGMCIVEPWLTPDTFVGGTVSATCAESDGTAVARVNKSDREGDLSIITMEYVVADATGTRHVTEKHVVGLFTPEQYVEAFEAAGLSPTFEAPDDLHIRGLLVATRPSP